MKKQDIKTFVNKAELVVRENLSGDIRKDFLQEIFVIQVCLMNVDDSKLGFLGESTKLMCLDIVKQIDIDCKIGHEIDRLKAM